MPNYNSFLNSGFYRNYNEQQRRENLFFVFEKGSDEQPTFNSSYIRQLQSKMVNAIDKAIQLSEQNEYGLISELCKYLNKDTKLGKLYKKYVQADPYYQDIKDIIAQGGASNSQQVMKFFNSRYFNANRMAMGVKGDSIMMERGESMDSAGLGTDAFWRKLHQDSHGLVTAASKAVTYQEAYENLKEKWRKYAYGKKGNTWSTVGSYFGSMGQAFKSTGLEDEILYGFLGTISYSKKTPEQVKALIEEGDNAKFKVAQSKNGELIQMHGQFQGQLAAILAKFYLPKLYGRLGTDITVTATGDNSAAYSSVNFDQNGQGFSRGNIFNIGQTDVQIDFTFKDDGNPISYRINVSAKMNQSFNRVQDSSKRHPDRYLVRVYAGGTLSAAINRIYSSTLFRESGIMTSDDFIDLAYLLINAAQGGITADSQEQAIQAYRAAIAFVGMEDLGEITPTSPSELIKGQATIDGSAVGKKVVNLFLINGEYFPASAYFRALKQLVQDGITEAMSTNLKFATTFPESESSDMQSYSPAYLTFIVNNDIADVNSAQSTRGHGYVEYFQGNPQKMRDYILKNSKAQEFSLKWATFWRNFTG